MSRSENISWEKRVPLRSVGVGRSTLCTMMAQLAEETQPFFETTLKSKAVSENCSVKFCCVVTGESSSC